MEIYQNLFDVYRDISFVTEQPVGSVSPSVFDNGHKMLGNFRKVLPENNLICEIAMMATTPPELKRIALSYVGRFYRQPGNRDTTAQTSSERVVFVATAKQKGSPLVNGKICATNGWPSAPSKENPLERNGIYVSGEDMIEIARPILETAYEAHILARPITSLGDQAKTVSIHSALRFNPEISKVGGTLFDIVLGMTYAVDKARTE